MSCIDVEGLTKLYGKMTMTTTVTAAAAAVDNITFTVDRGQIFGFLGPNGAGKSTTIKLLTTLIRPTSGSISVLGIDAIRNPLAVRNKIGVVLQQPSYEPTLSVEKALEKYGMMWDVPKDVRKRRAKSLLEEFGLDEIKNKRNEDLSIGQRRRVQVAREFMHDMDLLFLDEPTVGLDPGARRDLLDYLRDRVSDTGLSIFYTTHILTEAEYLCDEIAIMNKGRLLEVDTPDALKSRLGDKKTVKIHLLNRPPPEILDMLSDVQGCKINLSGPVAQICDEKSHAVDSSDNHSHNNTNSPPNSRDDTRADSHTFCKDPTTGRATITIHSSESELALLKILKILYDAHVEIEDLSAVPTSLEEIFLGMTEMEKKSTDPVEDIATDESSKGGGST